MIRRLLPTTPRARAALAGALAAAVLLRAGAALDLLPAWAAAWGDDLVCLPLVLAAALAVHRLAGGEPGWRLPAAHGLAAVILFAVVFEVLLPALGGGATADPLDAAAYLGGWLYFQLAINPHPSAALPARTVSPEAA